MSKEEKAEVVEFELLTPEQIEELPDSVHDNVVFLTDNARPKELQKLNPLVTRLLNMRRNQEELKLLKDEEGNIKPECIEEYKALKAEQRSFNGDLTKTAKKLQKPYQDINKGFLEIKKTFKTLSDEVKEEAEKKFAEYEAEKKRKKKEAQDKKDAALKAEIEKRDQHVEEITSKQKVSEVYNNIKFIEITENISDNASDAVVEKNEDFLELLKSQIAQITFDKVKSKYEVNLLSEEQLEELEKFFDKAKDRSIRMIQDKLDAYELQRESDARKAVERSAPVPPPPAPGPEQETEEVSIRKTTDEEFVEKITNSVAALEMAVDNRMAENASAVLAKLKQRFNQFNS